MASDWFSRPIIGQRSVPTENWDQADDEPVTGEEDWTEPVDEPVTGEEDFEEVTEPSESPRLD
jgi:hypothetical protein